MKVTQVASRPPSAPAVIGDKRAGIAEGGHEAHELQDHDQRSGRGLGHAEAVQHLARPKPVVVLDRLLRDIGQHRVGAAEGHHRHLREEDRDLAEDVAGPERPAGRRRPAPATARARWRWRAAHAPTVGRAWAGKFLAEQAIGVAPASLPPCWPWPPPTWNCGQPGAPAEEADQAGA